MLKAHWLASLTKSVTFGFRERATLSQKIKKIRGGEVKNDRGRQLTPTSGLLTLACAGVHTQTWTYTNTHTHGEKLCHSETIIAQEESENTHTLVVFQTLCPFVYSLWWLPKEDSVVSMLHV